VVTSVANAYLDCIPILFIGGAPPLSDAEMLPLQGGIDQLTLMQPITKWAHRITHVQRVPDLVAQALRVATTGRPACLSVMTDPSVIHPITQMMVTGAVPKPDADDKIRMPYYGERDA